MTTVNTDALFYYVAFSVFIYYQQLHVKSFRGSSQLFQVVLTLSAFLGVLTGMAYLIFYAVQVSILGAGIFFLASLATVFLNPILERIFGPLLLSLMAFVGWPICAYLMYQAI